MFPLNAKKVQICKIMFHGFAVKIQQCVKKVGSFRFVKIFAIWLAKSLTNCLMHGRQYIRIKGWTDAFFRAVQCLV